MQACKREHMPTSDGAVVHVQSEAVAARAPRVVVVEGAQLGLRGAAESSQMVKWRFHAAHMQGCKLGGAGHGGAGRQAGHTCGAPTEEKLLLPLKMICSRAGHV